MKTNTRILILSIINIGIIFSFFKCDDIFEEDISSESFTLLAPSNGVSTKIVSQIFWWEEVKGATKYNLQIVKPTFSNVESVVLDSLTVNTKFDYVFSPGNYEWKVIASNSSSYKESEIFSLEIIVNDISSISFSLLSPPNNSTSGQLNQTFWWEKVEGAEEYDIQIVSPSFNSIEKLILDSTITDNKLNYILDEDSYQWKIIAINSTSQKESDIFTFAIDTSSNPKHKINVVELNFFKEEVDVKIDDLLNL